jgi:hypothetical protein
MSARDITKPQTDTLKIDLLFNGMPSNKALTQAIGNGLSFPYGNRFNTPKRSTSVFRV